MGLLRLLLRLLLAARLLRLRRWMERSDERRMHHPVQAGLSGRFSRRARALVKLLARFSGLCMGLGWDGEIRILAVAAEYATGVHLFVPISGSRETN